ncbi:4124_t:CDS:2, partial [Entrophospora sp. SA101]
VKKSNFNLPTNILSPEIVKAVNAKHSNKNKRKRSAAAAKRTNKKNNNYASSIDSYKIPKQKKVKINLDEEQIKSLPVQEKYPPYPANEYVFTPHIKETTPSVLVRHPQRLDAIQIQHDFEERTIMDNISMLLQAKLEEITNRYNETKRIRDLLAIASVDIKKKCGYTIKPPDPHSVTAIAIASVLRLLSDSHHTSQESIHLHKPSTP